MTSSGPSVYARVEVPIRPMMKIEALIHPFKLEEVNGILQDLDCEEVTISEVLHRGGPNIQKTVYRGCEYRVDVPRVKVEMLVSSLRVDEVVEALSRAVCGDLPGNDGSILVYEVAEAIRIRNGRRVEFSFS